MARASKATAAKPSQEVAVRPTSDVAVRPAFLASYKGPLGNEGIESADITIPRLKIAQAITQEVKDGDLKEGELFLNVTGQSVWQPNDKPLPVVIVARNKEFILWRPRKDGGGILARAKPVVENGVVRYRWDKPNQKFDVKVDGKTKVTWATKDYIDQDGLGEWGSEIPGNKESGIAATAHHNYVVVLPSVDNMIAAVSMTKSQVKKAKDLNAVLKMVRPDLPIGAKLFSLGTMDDTSNDGQQYKNWSVKFDRGLDSGSDADNALGGYALDIQKGFQATGFNVDQSTETGEADEESGKKKAF